MSTPARADAALARPVVAAFDVDGTLTKHSCVLPFLRRVAGSRGFVVGVLRQAHRVAPAAVRRDRDRLKQLSASAALRGRTVADIAVVADEFAAVVAADGLREDTVARLRWHRASGHRVVLVSASFGVYLRPLAPALGVDAVLGTELEVDGAGRYTGSLDGANCRGEEKRRRLHHWLEDHGGRCAVTVWAYGDSPDDVAMLTDADVAVWTGEPIPSAPPNALAGAPMSERVFERATSGTDE